MARDSSPTVRAGWQWWGGCEGLGPRSHQIWRSLAYFRDCVCCVRLCVCVCTERLRLAENRINVNPPYLVTLVQIATNESQIAQIARAAAVCGLETSRSLPALNGMCCRCRRASRMCG